MRRRVCRVCGRPGKVVVLPEGFPLPEGEKSLALCQWHKAADTRRVNEIEAINEELARVLEKSREIEAEGKRILEGK